MKKIILFILLFVLFNIFPVISADVISLNSGGSEAIVINPDTYIEGFFGCVPTTCAKLGYGCDSWSDNCGKILNCGSCASGYTCTSGTCVATPVTPPSAGPGGGGGPSAVIQVAVTPTSINLNLAVNTTSNEWVINVKNLKTNTITVPIYQSGLTNKVILGNTSLTLAAGETKKFSIWFAAPDVEPDIYTGYIFVDGVKIPVSLNVKTKLLLFDSNIVVLNRGYKVAQGSDLRTRVTLIPMGDPERLDVALNYVIKDYDGKVYLTQSETVLVEKKINFRRNFDTGSLPLGKYIVGLELVYSGGVAPSSAHFEVVQKTATDFLVMLVFVLLISIILIAILIIFLIIRRRRQKEREEV